MEKLLHEVNGDGNHFFDFLFMPEIMHGIFIIMNLGLSFGLCMRN